MMILLFVLLAISSIVAGFSLNSRGTIFTPKAKTACVVVQYTIAGIGIMYTIITKASWLNILWLLLILYMGTGIGEGFSALFIRREQEREENDALLNEFITMDQYFKETGLYAEPQEIIEYYSQIAEGSANVNPPGKTKEQMAKMYDKE